MKAIKLKDYVEEKQLARCSSDFNRLLVAIHFKYPKFYQNLAKEMNKRND